MDFITVFFFCLKYSILTYFFIHKTKLLKIFNIYYTQKSHKKNYKSFFIFENHYVFQKKENFNTMNLFYLYYVLIIKFKFLL